MERLNTTAAESDSAFESAVHLARYAIALPFCNGKRVLDVSCGEGYGARLLRASGALAVDGVDNAELAILRAREEFGGDGITFHCADAEKIEQLFGPNAFDLIVCLETIEHVPNPAALLRSIRQVARDGAIIIVSCPNDHWYYPTDDTANPFHVRKYSFDEYRAMTVDLLGTNVQWLLGAAMFGFGTAPIDGQQRTAWQSLSSRSWLRFRRQQAALAVPGLPDDTVGPWNCSYFVGIWGAPPATAEFTSTTFPISMDRYVRCASALLSRPDTTDELVARERHMNALISTQQAELDRLKAYIGKVERDSTKFQVQASALAMETDIMAASIGTLRSERDSLLREREQLSMEREQLAVERDQLRVPAQRYLRLTSSLRKMAPERARPLIRRMARRFLS